MGEATKIEWCDATFNPWWGCVRVSPGCTHCYAESFSHRLGLKIWGPSSGRRFFGDKHWQEPFKWNAQAAQAGERRRVFCASMADVFEDRPELVAPRQRLSHVIEETPSLDWLLLSKRPENMIRLAPDRWLGGWPPNVWAGCTVENQEYADIRATHLLRVPARIRFFSAEPLLGSIDMWSFFKSELRDRGLRELGETYDWPGISWVIAGSESGPGARPMRLEWVSNIVSECRNAGVPVFVKQIANERDKKGGDPKFWPPGDWPRQFPESIT